MNSILKTESGRRQVLEVTYNPRLMDWDEAIERALKEHGLQRGKATIIAIPEGGQMRLRYEKSSGRP